MDTTSPDPQTPPWIAFPGKVPVCQDCGTDWQPVRRGECIKCGSDKGPLETRVIPPGLLREGPVTEAQVGSVADLHAGRPIPPAGGKA